MTATQKIAAARPAIIHPLILVLSASSGGCGDSASGGSSTTIIVTTMSQPALIAFRDGIDSDWQTPAAKSVGRYEIAVHGPYTVEVVCVGRDAVRTVEISRTPADSRELDMSCAIAEPRMPWRLTGTMVQAGRVAFGTSTSSSFDDNWQFDLPAQDGRFDLIAQANFGLGVVIRRDIEIAGSVVFDSTIDVDVDGVSTTAYPVTVLNQRPDEVLYVGSRVETQSTRFAITAVGDVPYILSSDVLRSTDRQYVTAEAQTPFDQSASMSVVSYRSIARELTPGASHVLALPPAIDAARFTMEDNELTATWSDVKGLELGSFDTLTLDCGALVRDGDLLPSHYAHVSARYVDAAGAISTKLHTNVPGYEAAWRTNIERAYAQELQVSKSGKGSDDSLAVMVSQALNLSPPAVVGNRVTRHRGLRSPSGAAVLAPR